MTSFAPDNQIDLLRNGIEYFPALEASINAAQYEIHLQTYIFELDDIGLSIGDALKRAATRGVLVFLLLDGFGSKGLSKVYIKALREAGVEVLFFRPKISPWTLKRARLRRMHRKVVVIDGVIGFVGGINIISDFNTPSHVAPRVDYAVRVRGPILKSIHANVSLLWHKVSSAQNGKVHDGKVHASSLNHEIKHKVAGSMRVAFLVRDNFKHRREIEDAYLLAIASAKREVLIANSYFLPSMRFRHALRDAAARGVRVVLILQSRVEYLLLDFASHALYSNFLDQGMEIYEYYKSFMHSKVAVIDSKLAIVGSSNIDPFSLFMSLEANVSIDDKVFASALREDLKRSIELNTKPVTADYWQQYYIRRFFSWIIYGLVKAIIGVVGYSDND